MPTKVQNMATTVLDKLGTAELQFRPTPYVRRVIREINEFASHAETLLQSARLMAPIIGHPAVRTNAVVLANAPAYAETIKKSTQELSAIHKHKAAICKLSLNREDFTGRAMLLSQEYVTWMEAYQQEALPLAAVITDAFMEVSTPSVQETTNE